VAFNFIVDASTITSALNRDLELAKIAGIDKATTASFPTVMSRLS
jgi:hypothetical protein